MTHILTPPTLVSQLVRRLPFLVMLVVTVNCGDNNSKSVQEEPSATFGLLDNKCYSPTKTVTKDDKIAWINKYAKTAMDAEKLHGTPAAAILAMTAAEGGFGSTKTAVNANNPFGWKGTGTPDDIKPFTLTCQPKSDPGNQYIAFKSFESAIMYVTGRLAAMEGWNGTGNYKAATDRYIKDRQSGMDVKQAVNRWVDGLADAKYNYDPATYKKTIKGLAGDFMTGESPSAEFDLYKYSRSVTPKSGL